MSDFSVSIRRFFDLKGRSQRREFFLSILGIAAALIVIYQAAFLLWFVKLRCYAVWILPFVVWLVFGMCVRRLHDVGKPFYWMFVPVIGFLFLFKDSEPCENAWGLDPKSVYCIDDFFSNEDYYKYLDNCIEYKHCLLVSIIVACIKLACVIIILVVTGWCSSVYRYETTTNYFDLDKESGIRLEIPNQLEFTELSVRDVCCIKYRTDEFDSRLLIYKEEYEGEIVYDASGDSCSVHGSIDVEGVCFSIDGYVSGDKESRKKLKHLVKLCTEGMCIKEHVSIVSVLKDGIYELRDSMPHVLKHCLSGIEAEGV